MRRRAGQQAPVQNLEVSYRRKQRAAARELARTPVADPYRGQLHDPHPSGQSIAHPDVPATNADDPVGAPAAVSFQAGADVRISIPPGLAPGMLAPGYPTSPRANAPRSAVLAAVLGLILGALAALFGFVLIAGVALVNTFGETDRSFYRGADATMVIIGVLDFALAAAGVLGGVALLGGRLGGRLWLTAFGWTMLGLSWYWIRDGRVATIIPLAIAATSAVMLLVVYHPGVTRWLGVQPPPQPE